MFRPDGEEVWIRDSSVLVHQRSGHRLAWQGVIEDITTERRAEEEDPRLGGPLSSAHRARAGRRVRDGAGRRTPNAVRQPARRTGARLHAREWLEQPDIWIELLHADDREVVLAAARPEQSKPENHGTSSTG